MGWKKSLQLFLLRATDGFQMGHHTLELTPAKGTVVLTRLCHACCPWVSTRLDSCQVRCPESECKNPRSTSSGRKKAVGVPCWEQRNRTGSHSKVSCQISHFIWLQSPCGWNVTSSSSGSWVSIAGTAASLCQHNYVLWLHAKWINLSRLVVRCTA